MTHQDPALNQKANIAQCYFWIYKRRRSRPRRLRALVFAQGGRQHPHQVKNNLDERHDLSIPGIGFTTGPIAHGATFTGTIIDLRPERGTTYLYFTRSTPPSTASWACTARSSSCPIR